MYGLFIETKYYPLTHDSVVAKYDSIEEAQIKKEEFEMKLNQIDKNSNFRIGICQLHPTLKPLKLEV